jgi:conjugative transfer region protein TrbK
MSATMDMTIATRSVAYVALAGALLAAAITLNDRRYPATPAWKTEPSPSATALDAELARCKAIGAEVANDAVCKAMWDANRKRFFESRKLDRITGVAPDASDLKEPASTSGGERPRNAPQLPSTQNSDAPRPSAATARQLK